MDKRWRLLASGLMLVLGGCASILRESGEWRKQVDQSVLALQESLDAVAKAVPGERWARQMEALTHPDNEVRRKALEDLAAGTLPNVHKSYRVRALMTSSDGKAIRARLFLAPTNQPAELESFCALGKFVSLDSWRSTPIRPKLPEEVRMAARQKATELLDLLFGKPMLYRAPHPPGEPNAIGWRPTPPLGTPIVLQHTNIPTGHQSPAEIFDRYSAAVDALTDLLALHYDQIALDNMGGSFSKGWSATEGYGVLHVIMPSEDLARLESISAWIHEEDNPNATWDDMTIRVLRPSSFDRIPAEVALRCYDQDEDLHWQAANLSGSVYHSAPSAELVQQLSRMRAAVERLTQIYDSVGREE